MKFCVSGSFSILSMYGYVNKSIKLTYMCTLKPLFIETFFIVHHIFSAKILANILSFFQFNKYVLDYLNMKVTYWQLVSNLCNFIENSVLELRQLSSHRMKMRNNMYIKGDCQKKKPNTLYTRTQSILLKLRFFLY